MIGLTFDPTTHSYALDGERLPSVTGILKYGGLVDFSQIPSTTLAAARLRGTTVHRAIHFFNENDLDVDAFYRDFPDYAGYLRGWVTFCEQRHFLPLLNEYRVVSRRHRVAGTLDSLGVLDGRAILLDFATGRPDDVCKNLQTAAYYGLAMEAAIEDRKLQKFFNSYPVVQRAAVALKADGSFTIEQYREPTDYREFLALASAFWVVAKHRPRAWRDLAEVA
jgi:hypothetical protein